MAKILVTGGAGFIGSHIVDIFKKDGHQVAVVDNLSSGNRANLPSDIPLHIMDIRSPEARMLVQTGNFDLVVHTAAQISVRASMDNPSFDAEVNVVGLVNLLQPFMQVKGPKFIFLSTGGAIYGEQDTFPATEEHPQRPASVYGHAKLVGEMYLGFWERVCGLSFCALRLANVYGPRQNPHGEAGVIAIFLKKLFAGEVPAINGTGAQTRDFVYVGDVARAVKGAFDAQVTGVYNIGTGVETSLNDLYTALQLAAKKNVKPSYLPAKSGEQMRSCIDASKAGRAFKWKPAFSLDEGLKATADWFSMQK